MNPCAPAFIPSSQSSESDPDSAKKPTRSPVKGRPARAARDGPSLKQKPKHKRNKSSVSEALDPKKYDTMFPSLPSVSPPKEQPAQKAKPSKKKKKNMRAKKVSVHSPENEGPSKPSGAAVEGQTAPEKAVQDETIQEETVQEASEEPEPGPKPELLKPTVYTPGKPALELLKPTVYTPPASSHARRRDNRVDNFQSPRGRVNKLIGGSSRPRTRPDVPPTPHQDPRNRGRNQPAARYPVTRVGTPTGIHAPVPLDPNPSQGPMMGPFDPEGAPFPPMCGPFPMPIPMVPWGMMPAPWHPYQPQMPFFVGNYDEQFPFWPQPLPVASQAPQLQGPPRPGSCESSEHSDSLSTPQTTAAGARGGHQASNSLGAVPGPGTDIIPRTQVEMFKNQQRARSSNPRGPRFLPKGKAAWMKASPLGKTCQIAAPIDKGTPVTTAAKTFDKHLREVTDPRKCAGFIPTRQVQTSLGSPRVVNGPSASSYNDSLLRNYQMPREQLPQQADSSVAGPSSQRRPLKPVNSNAQVSSALAGPESGTWSQSKRWTSTATKERQSFQKMMANLRYMGADQSPFVPQTPAELTAFKAAIAEAQKLKLSEEVRRRVARSNAKNEEGEAKQVLSELMGGKIFSDHLSPVFAMNNCFSKKLPSNLVMQAEWPPLSEFKEEGDKRAGRPGRCLPLPRLNIVAARYINRPWEAYNPDGTIRWDKKVVQVGSHLICAVTQPDASITPPVELQIDTLHFLLKAMLGEIDGVESNGDKKDVEEEKEKEEVSTEQDSHKEQES